MLFGYTKERCANCGGPVRHTARYMLNANEKGGLVWCSVKCQNVTTERTDGVRVAVKNTLRCQRSGCEKTFQSTRSTARFCSQGCQKKDRRRECTRSPFQLVAV
jgi:hypothetical protein